MTLINLNSSKIYSRILLQRNFYLGVAMLLILFFHLFYGYKLQPWKAVFSRGFYGVDIFLFFSAFGLCYSYNKNSLSNFYKNRAKRVLPFFITLAIFRIMWYVCHGNTISIWEVFATLTGLSYFIVLGGIWVDWYLCALLILYAIFPVTYRFIKKYSWGGVILVSIISSLICLMIPLNWEHACLIGRLPVFCYGVLFNFIIVSKEINMNRLVFVLLCIYGLMLFSVDVLYPNGRTRFLAPSFIAPIMIIVITLLYNIIDKNASILRGFINSIGKHSLEIYIANCFSLYFCHEQGLDLSGYSGALTELVMIAAITPILYIFNKSITFQIFK